MTYKKCFLTLMLLSYNAAQGMNGYVQALSTADVNGKIAELWKEKSLTEKQKIAKFHLYLLTAENKLKAKLYSDAMNPKDISMTNPLDEAMTAHKSPGLFRLLLAHKADPQISTGAKGTVASRAAFRGAAFQDAIDEQAIMNAIETDIMLALCGAQELEIAERLKTLMTEKRISKDIMFRVLDTLVLRKDEEFEILDNVAIALQTVLENKTYVKSAPTEKKTLRAQLAQQSNANTAVAADQNSTVTVEAVKSSPLSGSAMVGGALACVAVGFGGKYILDALLSQNN